MKTLLAILAASLAFAAEAPYTSAGFLKIPAEVKLGPMSAVEVDRKGNMYVLHRGEPPLLAFDKDGKYKGGFGSGEFKVAHGLRADKDGNIWTTDNGLHILRKFSPKGETVMMTGAKHSSTIEICVIDKGPGIPEEHQEAVFEKFRQLRNQPNVKGTGLGLAICKAIVEEHGGKIGCTSTVGSGSTFWIRLPSYG